MDHLDHDGPSHIVLSDNNRRPAGLPQRLSNRGEVGSALDGVWELTGTGIEPHLTQR
jgi:hypothetical protein